MRDVTEIETILISLPFAFSQSSTNPTVPRKRNRSPSYESMNIFFVRKIFFNIKKLRKNINLVHIIFKIRI